MTPPRIDSHLAEKIRQLWLILGSEKIRQYLTYLDAKKVR